MRPQIVKILTLVLFVTNSTAMLAQSLSSRSGPPAPNRTNHPPELPIDDYFLVLIFVGLLYGAFIAYKKYKIKDSLQ
ncbi:MAG: hypothetical protein COB12_04070 [Flavobacterium sp.]|nr:MAG: hypothetical protein COB12_04070 [Flavobacterium sp.]